MRQLLSALLVTSAIAAAGGAPARAEEWRTYINPRFGTIAEVPRDWRTGRPPENGDGLTFTSPDGQATITVSGSLQTEDSVQEAMDLRAEPDESEIITYQQRDPKWIVVSGKAGSKIFYRKSLLSCGDQIWNNVSIEYPAARKAQFDPLVAHVARSLRGGRSAQIPNCR